MIDTLGDRMKVYEDAYRVKLPIRMPVIIRLDGKAFHTFTRGMNKPFDVNLVAAMIATTVNVMSVVQTSILAYVQSDEISLLLHNYKKLNSQAWFDNTLQKIVSVSASAASSYISRIYDQQVLFDARAFVLPEAEVANYFIWRQKDAIRNSIQSVAQLLYSHRELHGKNSAALIEMCNVKGVDWNALPVFKQRGICVDTYSIDKNIPVFTQDRAYIERYLKQSDCI
jgi:tRNA(His) 5'-end guanylyltransferase